MLRPHALLQDGPAPDRFPNGVLPLVDVVAQGVEARRRQDISGVRIHPLLLVPPPHLAWHLAIDAPRRLHMKAIKGASCGVGEAPRLAAVEEDGGDNGLVEHTRNFGLDLLLRADLGNLPPDLTCALEVTPDGWLVTVVPRDVPSKILVQPPPTPPPPAAAVAAGPRASGTWPSARAARYRRPRSAARRGGTWGG